MSYPNIRIRGAQLALCLNNLTCATEFYAQLLQVQGTGCLDRFFHGLSTPLLTLHHFFRSLYVISIPCSSSVILFAGRGVISQGYPVYLWVL